jgi:hypothetical protein
LQVLLSVESDSLGFDFAFLDINFVAGEDDGDVFANTDEITWGELETSRRHYGADIILRCQFGTFL